MLCVQDDAVLAVVALDAPGQASRAGEVALRPVPLLAGLAAEGLLPRRPRAILPP